MLVVLIRIFSVAELWSYVLQISSLLYCSPQNDGIQILNPIC
jgi:hypothetical protein